MIERVIHIGTERDMHIYRVNLKRAKNKIKIAFIGTLKSN